MSGESAPGAKDERGAAARWVAAGASRVARVWRVLPDERRLAAGAAIALFFTLFLPWYQETVIVPGKSSNLRAASVTLTGWGAFSFVEAALLLVAAGVLTLLFQRAEGRAFHIPGGDGTVITAAGAWACVLVIWRIFDKQGTSTNGQLATSSGIEWGIFIALAVAVVLTYAGTRIRAAHQPEPPLPGEKPSPAAPKPPAPPNSRSAPPTPAKSPSETSGSTKTTDETAPRRRRPASLSAPASAAPSPYPRAALRPSHQERSEHPTLPQPDPDDKPTLRQRAPGSLWQAPPESGERDTEPKPSPDEHMTIPFDRRDDG